MSENNQAFLYLAVLVSIIFGLAIQQVLLGYRDLILSRSKVRLHWPVVIWSFLMLLIVAQNWWESFGLAGRQDWNFFAFAVILAQAVIIYMLAAVIFPQSANEDPIDLERHYFAERHALYGFAIAYVISSPVRAFFVDGTILPPLDWLFHALFLVLFGCLGFFRNARFHVAALLAIVALFLTYIATMSPVLVRV